MVLSAAEDANDISNVALHHGTWAQYGMHYKRALSTLKLFWEDEKSRFSHEYSKQIQCLLM